jgi:hypothetical protein
VVLLDQLPDHNSQKPLLSAVRDDMEIAISKVETVLEPVIPVVKTILKPVIPIVEAVKRKLSALAAD